MSEFSFDEFNSCTLCPRHCKANRNASKLGVCKVPSQLYVTRATLHPWEEPCISGQNGSGTVFFAGCNLHCVFCQNYAISGGPSGFEITPDRLCDIFLELLDKGAHNINLVTPTHYLPQVIYALKRAKSRGLSIPIVYNTSGYESVESLQRLEGLIDIYLPDFKYFEKETGKFYSNASDYFEVASYAICEMVRQVGAPSFFENGLMKNGVIVRHLVLPGHTKEAQKIIRTLYEEHADNLYFSILNQYTPFPDYLPEGEEYDLLRRTVTKREYEKVVSYALELGITNAFIQEGGAISESFVPAFTGEGVLPG